NRGVQGRAWLVPSGFAGLPRTGRREGLEPIDRALRKSSGLRSSPGPTTSVWAPATRRSTRTQLIRRRALDTACASRQEFLFERAALTRQRFLASAEHLTRLRVAVRAAGSQRFARPTQRVGLSFRQNGKKKLGGRGRRRGTERNETSVAQS